MFKVDRTAKKKVTNYMSSNIAPNMEQIQQQLAQVEQEIIRQKTAYSQTWSTFAMNAALILLRKSDGDEKMKHLASDAIDFTELVRSRCNKYGDDLWADARVSTQLVEMHRDLEKEIEKLKKDEVKEERSIEKEGENGEKLTQ